MTVSLTQNQLFTSAVCLSSTTKKGCKIRSVNVMTHLMTVVTYVHNGQALLRSLSQELPLIAFSEAGSNILGYKNSCSKILGKQAASGWQKHPLFYSSLSAEKRSMPKNSHRKNWAILSGSAKLKCKVILVPFLKFRKDPGWLCNPEWAKTKNRVFWCLGGDQSLALKRDTGAPKRQQ